ncbi:5-formyltetrahydrofolate cyclo-ligase [Tenacibaculum sp. KUL113]|nr:5-formyltetrahydrofolate cyclo-ligase [Tenacibaculum sp. KUL113]
MVSEQILKSRTALRKELREARRALSAVQQEEAARGIAEQLHQLPLLKRARNIAGYLVNDGEVDLGPYIASQWQSTPSKQFALPVLHPVCKGHLLFLFYSSHTALVKNKYKIKEPALSCQNVLPTSQCDVILMPLVGFDIKGNRLGMGGGYYDRTLAFTQTKRHSRDQLCPKNPKLVGIAHDIQEVKSLPIAPWDVPLDAIVTPTRTLIFNNT